MSLYSWNVIEKVMEYRSITRAAYALNLTPSAVSHMVKKMEAEVGYPIFVKTRNSFELTDNGRALLPFVQNYLKAGRALKEEALRLKNTIEGTVSIASYNTIIKNWLPPVLRSFHDKYPEAKIVIHQSNDIQIQTWIEHGEIDLAIAFNSYINAASFIPLHSTPIVCFTPLGYEPRNGLYMTAEDLRDMPIIMRTDNFDEEVQRLLVEAGVPLDSTICVDNDEPCYEYIRQGFGFRISSAITYPNDPCIRKYPIENGVSRVLGLITASPQYLSPVVNLFRKEIIAYLSDNNLMNI